jgi:hypothetical protein
MNLPPENKPSSFTLGFGKVFRFIAIFGAGLIVIFLFWPDISQRPIGALTLADISFSLIIGVIGLGLLGWAFTKPSDESAEIWAGAALFLAIAAGVFLYKSSR